MNFFFPSLFAANLLDLASSAPAPKEKIVNDVLRYNDLLKWNYEYEKSYWFDTSAMNERNNPYQPHEDVINNTCASSSSASSNASCSPQRYGASTSGNVILEMLVNRKVAYCQFYMS